MDLLSVGGRNGEVARRALTWNDRMGYPEDGTMSDHLCALNPAMAGRCRARWLFTDLSVLPNRAIFVRCTLAVLWVGCDIIQIWFYFHPGKAKRWEIDTL